MSSPVLQRRSRKLVSEINVVPYIDVMLVLLIIFMVTAPLVMQGIDVDLPQVESELVPTEEDPPLIVTITAAGEIYLAEFLADDDDATPLSGAALVQQVLAVKRARPAAPVLIRGDQAVPYGAVVSVMNALKVAGVPEVGLITMPVDTEIEAIDADDYEIAPTQVDP